MIGTTLDKYEVLQKVGEGGMATVYRGRHSTLNRDVAIKVLHPHLSSSNRNRMRFAREAKAVERLRHENILEIFDYSGQDAQDCYIVTEFVDGETLTALLHRHGQLPSEIVAMIGIRVARALAFAHEEGILHRDLKTDNIMLRVDGTLKLMDFGIARFLDESQVTMTGALVGSPAFMSPEQAREGDLDQRSDLFSFGTVLFYLVTGHLPFSGSNPSLILKNVIEGNRLNVAELAPKMSASLADIVERLLSTSPDDRFNSAFEVETALAACIAEVQVDTEDSNWSVLAFMTDAEAYERRLEQHLAVVLLEQGQRLLEVGDHLAALRMFNRLLSMDEENQEVLSLVQNLHGPAGGNSRRGAWIAAGALLAVVLVLAALWVLSTRDAEPEASNAVAELLPLDPPLALPKTSPNTSLVPTATTVEEPEPSQVAVTDPAPTTVAARAKAPTKEKGTVPPRRTVRIKRNAKPGQLPQPEPAYGTVVINTNGPSAEVYLRGVRIGATGEVLRLPVGSHDLEIRSDLFYTQTMQDVVVSPGERRMLPVKLKVLPAAVVFPPGWPADCLVVVSDATQQGVNAGTIGSLGRRLRVERPDGRVSVVLDCPNGDREVRQWPLMTGENLFPPPSVTP